MELVYTIYCHTHIESGRRYVGLTSQTMEKRWNQHVSRSKSSKGGRWHFPNAIRKYGKDAFSHEILETCDSLEKANTAEEKWIEHFKTRDPEFGFNLKKGGAHTPHPISNPWDRPEYREKASAASRARWKDPAIRAKIESKLADVRADPDYRSRMSASSRQAFSDPGVRQKHSDSLKGKKLSEAHCAKISDNLRKNQADPDVKKKLSARSKAIWEQPGFRELQSESHTGKTTSAEIRAKISASSKSSDPDVRAKISASLKRHFSELS